MVRVTCSHLPMKRVGVLVTRRTPTGLIAGTMARASSLVTSDAATGGFAAMRSADYTLCRFDRRFAPTVVSWVRGSTELFNLAPSTPPPLTAKKLIDWTKPTDRPLVLAQRRSRVLCGYAELNPMRTHPGQLWIGHVIVAPDMRGRGLGRLFVDKLVRASFAHLGARRIVLIVFPENTSAVRCYQSVGFELRGEEFHAFGSGRERHRMLRFEMGCPATPQLSSPSPRSDCVEVGSFGRQSQIHSG